MKNKETINLLEHAASEFQMLRAERDRLASQMEIVTIFRAALLGPPPPQGYGVDVVSHLRKHAEELRGKNEVPMEDAAPLAEAV